MYLLRGVVILLGVFFLVYLGLSMLIIFVWRMFGKKLAEQSAAILYGMRMLPLLGASIIVVFFTMPAFLYLEPRLAQERIGITAFAIAASGAVVLGVGLLNGATAWLNTSRVIRSYLRGSHHLRTTTPTPVYVVSSDVPLLFVAGLWRPQVLVSTGVLALLDTDEIDAAIRHEIAHVNRWDNIKKMVLSICSFPLLGGLECEWLKAAEVAADDSAAHSDEAAMSLASALVKLTRASERMKTPELGMTLLPRNGPLLRVRVERLLSRSQSNQSNNCLVWRPLLLSAALLVSMNYLWFLLKTHELTELLIR